ncbi:hypothetical protein [Streptomyces sp. KL116D]|uniref:hypothetical protein n=1 Tax=Streptomyces sp. KL116D TaxID=3045152 RepID=UPI00355732FD
MNSGPRRHIGTAERRVRLALAHRSLPAARAEHAEDVARSLVALHGTDPATVYLGVGARLADQARPCWIWSGPCTRTGRWCGCTGCGTPCSCSTEFAATVHASTGPAVAAKARAGLLRT